ncbi:MAG: DUF2817 domain-containing protein [Gammaproteobacteria bacterium]|jgi:hypothetical protein|nr:DUF2817 domain-containing protein [Gammaproteobacteria bacterium]MBU0785291.1 DUF2817 domain-containing protein [Gammaproteobacteria bacterium]MBU0815874.1 DUF2817 domain-containing protein [Gammaproteobacteria bacterium]MBU1787413.1 DUF2817 domain-containing protein [Gammaproteobacteria bacterium]
MHFSKPLAVWATSLMVAASAQAVARPCDEFYARLPNVSRALCNGAQLQPSDARSVKGRTIYTSEVKPAHVKWRVLVVGGIHGDELSSASMTLHWINMAQAEPQQTHWRFVPGLNPDGLFSRPSRRMNANGVDLNRNFPTPNWEKESVIYWEHRTRKDPRRWPGPTSLSEPETKFLYQEIQRFKPNLIVSIHAPYGVLDFDGPVRPPSKLGRLELNQVGVFPGSLGNFGGVYKGMPVVTIELPNATRTPLNVEMRQMWEELGQWMGKTVAQSEPPPKPVVLIK